MNGTPTESASVRFRRDTFTTIVESRGCRTLRDKASLIGCSVSTYWRISRGLQRPGPDFIGKVATALPEFPIERLFDFGISRD